VRPGGASDSKNEALVQTRNKTVSPAFASIDPGSGLAWLRPRSRGDAHANRFVVRLFRSAP